MVWDPMVGFKIPYDPEDSFFFLTCHTLVNGHEFNSMYIPTRYSESVVFLSKLG